MGLLLAARGRLEEAVAALNRAIELDPLDTTNWLWLSTMHAAGERLDLARQEVRRALEIAPEHPYGHAQSAMLSILEGRPAVALEEARFLVDQDRPFVVAVAEWDLGHRAESERAVAELIRRYSHNAAETVAEIYAWRGERDRAFEWLDRAFDQELWSVKFNPLLRKLKTDPRWNVLLRKMNLPSD